MPMLADPEFRDQLAPFLPAGDELPQDPTELANTLRSPQFQQVSAEVWEIGVSVIKGIIIIVLYYCTDWLIFVTNKGTNR